MKCLNVALIGLSLLAGTAVPARAALVSLSASGTITQNSSVDTTIPVGTPWVFEIIYNTAAPDRDFVLTGAPDPGFGRFTNEEAIPALTFFHYKAGSYEVTLDDPSDFGPFSAILITFGGVDAIDINVNAAEIFPPLAGGAVSFHADFNNFSGAIFTSDALPTNTSLGLQSFDESTVSLLTGGRAVSGSTSGMTSFTIASVPEPSSWVMAFVGLGVVAVGRRRG
ncbi:PEP-CTERM sorting domain-containing protein [Verrucomicrobiota bacterium sgz303538]